MIYDSDLLAGLSRRDPATCTWFAFTFTPIIEAKLRYKLKDQATVEDLRNDTFCRVLLLVDKNRVRDPAQFGSFVRGVCDNVVNEHFRKQKAASDWPEGFEPADPVPPIADLLVDDELKTLLRNDLSKLPAEEEKLIWDIYFHERDRKRMAEERGITVTGLNVRLCRAIKHLRELFFASIGSDACG